MPVDQSPLLELEQRYFARESESDEGAFNFSAPIYRPWRTIGAGKVTVAAHRVEVRGPGRFKTPCGVFSTSSVLYGHLLTTLPQAFGVSRFRIIFRRRIAEKSQILPNGNELPVIILRVVRFGGTCYTL